ncbi:hypothetical protein FNV43_RR21505 [Rhamnella rubrinervis]|uniref:Uncharacterized protein n=1 Tax=Rhamnella rubrinervis TaxID=2594499 RepID=A0A8K0DY05_9ROSA|nr:hypothetical protein FNV43_RR21505 [Rhamnella rubrinervis]
MPLWSSLEVRLLHEFLITSKTLNALYSKGVETLFQLRLPTGNPRSKVSSFTAPRRRVFIGLDRGLLLFPPRLRLDLRYMWARNCLRRLIYMEVRSHSRVRLTCEVRQVYPSKKVLLRGYRLLLYYSSFPKGQGGSIPLSHTSRHKLLFMLMEGVFPNSRLLKDNLFLDLEGPRSRENSTLGGRYSTQGELDLGRGTRFFTQGEFNSERKILNLGRARPGEEDPRPRKSSTLGVRFLTKGELDLVRSSTQGNLDLGRWVLDLGRALPGEEGSDSFWLLMPLEKVILPKGVPWEAYLVNEVRLGLTYGPQLNLFFDFPSFVGWLVSGCGGDMVGVCYLDHSYTGLNREGPRFSQSSCRTMHQRFGENLRGTVGQDLRLVGQNLRLGRESIRFGSGCDWATFRMRRISCNHQETINEGTSVSIDAHPLTPKSSFWQNGSNKVTHDMCSIEMLPHSPTLSLARVIWLRYKL